MLMDTPVFIVKADGTREAFDSSKLYDSLKRAGAKEDTANDIIRSILKEIEHGMTTSEIYRRAFSILRIREKPTAARYSLRRAVIGLGPTGFPFEDFVAEIFKAKGYEIKTRVVVNGYCVSHELDMVAKKDGKCIGAEMKFHNRPGARSDLKIALYVKARFDDVILKVKETGGKCEIDEGMLITNTKFTSDSTTYGKCVNLTMIGWTYPSKGNLQDLIEETKVHPLTALTSLSKHQKNLLLENRVVLCKTLQNNTNVMREIGISSGKIDEVLKESEVLCQP